MSSIHEINGQALKNYYFKKRYSSMNLSAFIIEYSKWVVHRQLSFNSYDMTVLVLTYNCYYCSHSKIQIDSCPYKRANITNVKTQLWIIWLLFLCRYVLNSIFKQIFASRLIHEVLTYLPPWPGAPNVLVEQYFFFFSSVSKTSSTV